MCIEKTIYMSIYFMLRMAFKCFLQPTTLQLLRSIIYPPVRATLREFQPTIEGRTKS